MTTSSINLDKYTNFKTIILGSLLVLLFLSLRWNTFTTPFERDEGEYAYSAQILREGEMPYENSFLQKPPLIIYIYFLGQLISPDSLWPPRLLAAIFVALTTLLLALIAKKELGKNAGWIAAFIVTPMLVMPQITAFSANTEIFMLLPLVSLLYLYVRSHDSTKLLSWFLAGLFSALAILFKPISLYVILFIFIVWFVELYKKGINISALIKRIGAISIGGISVLLLAISPFLLSDSGSYLWESVIVFNRFYADFWGYGLSNLVRYVGIFWSSYWVLFVLFAYLIWKRPERLWFYVGLLITALLAVYQTPIGHYYILVIPFVALISAYAIVLFSKEKFIRNYIRNNTEVWITAAILIIMLIPVRSQFGKTPEEFGLWVYGTTNPFGEAKIVADKIEDITDPGDYIFVAGSEPEIYYYAKRKSPTRFVITYPLIIDTPRILDYQKEAISDLNDDPPTAIVYSQRQLSGLWEEGAPREFVNYLDNLLEESYELSGGYIWRGNKGIWLEDLTEADKNNASLLLYNKVED